MAINKTLAQARGISQEDQDKIEELHTLVQSLIDAALEEGYPDKEGIKELIHQAELQMQTLWGFSQDRKFHTWAPKYKFKSGLAGRKFSNLDTNTMFTIPSTVEPRNFYAIGDGFLDVGDGYYIRSSANVKEIVE